MHERHGMKELIGMRMQGSRCKVSGIFNFRICKMIIKITGRNIKIISKKNSITYFISYKI